MDLTVIPTFRCNSRCQMCYIWKNPTEPKLEVTAETLAKLPGGFDNLNLSGGEPTLRRDLATLVDVLYPKARIMEISSNGLHPEKLVLSVNGDGDFLMSGQEFAIAVQYRLPIIVVVCDNGMYGTIRMHQERNYPARVHGTDLVNPDFVALAQAYGAMGETVTRTAEFAPALERALGADRPSLLWLKIDPQAITMSATLDQIREQARP